MMHLRAGNDPHGKRAKLITATIFVGPAWRLKQSEGRAMDCYLRRRLRFLTGGRRVDSGSSSSRPRSANIRLKPATASSCTEQSISSASSLTRRHCGTERRIVIVRRGDATESVPGMQKVLHVVKSCACTTLAFVTT